MKKNVLMMLFSLILLFVLSCFVAATNCWDTAYSASESACTTDNDDCQWVEDPWGSWCEQKGCWNLWTETDCSGSSASISKDCIWRTGTQSGWCMEMDCWSFDGTDQATCVNNPYGLNCTWTATYNEETYDYPCVGPPEKQCWSYQDEATCGNVTGCEWGMCNRQSCWDQQTPATCGAAIGFNGQSCTWESNSEGGWCQESGCWDYSTIETCQAASCIWDGGSCYQPWCSDFGYVDQATCEQNTAELNCNWNDPWCEEAGCWSNSDSATCNLANSSSGTPCYSPHRILAWSEA